MFKAIGRFLARIVNFFVAIPTQAKNTAKASAKHTAKAASFVVVNTGIALQNTAQFVIDNMAKADTWLKKQAA